MEEIKEEGIVRNIGNKCSDFKILKELGKGSYGVVYTVKSNLDDLVYVMKKMDLNNLKEKQQKECWKEVSILKKVNHPNIIKYYSSFLEKDCLYIIMEYAENGDLYSLIKHYKRHLKVFEEIDIWRIADEILIGLDYLHTQKIIHRDIKCLNLFITKDKHIKIGDLGVSTIVSNMNAMHITRVGTPLYLSPELVKQIPYDFKIDMWSFGCSLYHLACLEPPFTGDNIIVLGNNIVKGRQKAIPSQYSPELSKFIDTLLNKRPEKRPNAKEAFDFFPNEIKEKIKKIKANKEEGIKPRPFSSLGNRVITYNKEELQSKDIDIDKKDHEQRKLEVEKETKNEREKELEKEREKELEKEGERERLRVSERERERKREKKKEQAKEREQEQNKVEIVIEDEKTGRNDIELTSLQNILDNNEASNTNINFRKQKTDIITNNIKSDIINHFKKSQNPNQTPLKSTKALVNPNQINNNNDLLPNEIDHNSSFQKNNPISIKQSNKVLPSPNINSANFLSNYNEKSVNKLSLEEKNYNLRKIKREEPVVLNKNRNSIEHKSVKDYDRKQMPSNDNVDLQFPCLINDYKHTRNISPFSINKQIPSAKNPRSCRSQTKERPYTASNNRIFHSKPIANSSRPFTAANWKRSPNNIINININVFNIDMNKRFLAPEINPLKPSFVEDISLLKSLSHSSQISSNTAAPQINLRELGFQKKDFVFDKIIRTLENGHQSKQLTIHDLI